MAIKYDKVAKEMFDRFRAQRVDNIDVNRSIDAEQNIGVARYLDSVAISNLLTEHKDVITKDGKAQFIADATKAVNWSKSRLYAFLPIVDIFKLNEWIDVLGVVAESTAVKLVQDSKIERNVGTYNRGDILKYVVRFYDSAPKYVKELRTAFPCALANEDADAFVKQFIGVDTISEKMVVSALRAYHKPVIAEPEPTPESTPEPEPTDADADADDTPDSVLSENSKMRDRIAELEALLVAANSDLEKANKSLYDATHIKVSGDTYVIDAKLRRSVIAPAIRKTATEKGIEPVAVATAKATAKKDAEPIDRDADKLEKFAKKAANVRAGKKGHARRQAKLADAKK